MIGKKIFFAFILIFSLLSVVSAQDDVEKVKLKLALQNKLGTELISQEGLAENIYSFRKMPLLFGVFASYKKFEADIDLSWAYLNGNFRYNFFRDFWIGAEIGVVQYTVELDREYSEEDYCYDYNEGDGTFYKYSLKLGYEKVFFRQLEVSLGAAMGSLNSNTCLATDYVDSYFSGSNKKARKNDVYELDPTLIYGGEVTMTLLPNPRKDRHFPVSPFFTISFMGNAKSGTNRAVNIEEWIPGNVVYSETSNESSINYDLLYVKCQAGFRWYFNY